MTKDYYIYTDASADIDVKIIEKYGIRFVPMNYTVGDEERRCNSVESEEFLKKFYDAQREGKTTQTSQITPHSYIEEFTPILKEGKSVLYLALSSGLSKTYDSVTLAATELAEEFKDAKVVPVDSLGATATMGLLLEKAGENQMNGMSLEDNVAWIEANRLHSKLFLAVDDLMYLKRGGRIPATSAVIGTALNIKPIISIDEEGKLITVEKKRGVKQVLKELANKYAELRDESYGNRVYVVHGDCEDRAVMLEEMLKEVDPNVEISRMMVCPIIGSHLGPGTTVICFFVK